MTETFEQFCERMGNVERTEIMRIGPRGAGHTREIFDFEGQRCHLETTGLATYADRDISNTAKACLMAFGPKPGFYWLYAPFFYGKERVKQLQKYYRASSAEEDPYTQDPGNWFSFVFEDDVEGEGFKKLMKLIWDVHTGEFKEKWGNVEEEAWKKLEEKDESKTDIQNA